MVEHPAFNRVVAGSTPARCTRKMSKNKKLKVGINDGCANGGMMDSLSISLMSENPDWEPYYQTEVTQQEWDKWITHLRAHAEWERFWDKRCR